MTIITDPMSSSTLSQQKTLSCFLSKTCKIVFYALIFFTVLIGTGYPKEVKSILILNSDNSQDRTSNIFVYNIKNQLVQFAPWTSIYIEDLNFDSFPDESYDSILQDFLSKKYSKRRLNAILTIDNEALRFAVKYRESLFKDIPLVFSGSVVNYSEIINGHNNITGVVSETDLKNTLEVALNLHPDRKKIIILSDSTFNSTRELAKIKSSTAAFSNSCEFVYLDNIKQSEVISRIKPYEKSGILFLVGPTFLNPGKLFSIEDLCHLISKKLDMPVYDFLKGIIDHMTGGSYINPKEQATLTAQLILEILNGEDISKFPVRFVNNVTYLFNYDKLEHFNADITKLPPNSIIRGKPSSFLESNRSEIYFTVEGIIAVVIISILLFNIYKRKKTERALKTSEERFKGVYENVPIGIYRTTPDGRVLMANPALIKTLGYNNIDELSKINLNEDHKKAGYKRDLFKKEIEENGYVQNYQDTWVKKNGDLIYLMEDARLIKDSKGHPLYYEGIIQDITDKKTAENELQHYILELKKNKEIIENDAGKLEELNQILAASEKQLIELNQSKDKFFSIISHDLRSPFNSLLGFTDLLIRNFDEFSTEEIKSISRNIHNSLTHLYELIENILQWSGLQTGKIPHKPEIINLRRIVDQVIELLNGSALKKSITLCSTVSDNLFVNADRLMLFSVLQNLISNALKFTNPGGEIFVLSKEETWFHEITVKDNGVGMHADELDQIFKIDSSLSRSGTSGEKGTGLGLILCKELTEKNGGKIWVESIYGKATKFIFTVPRFIE